MEDLKNKRILVTGSRRGVGKAIAVELAQAGALVFLHGIEASDDLLAATQEVQQFSPASLMFTADLSDPQQTARLLDLVAAAAGGLDALVNNAATQKPRSVLELTAEDWDEVMAVNLRAPFLLAQHAARVMIGQGGGKIINISSVHAYEPRRNYAQYSCSKAGLEQLTRCLALELGEHNIQVNSVVLGAIATDLTPMDRQEAFSTAIPMERVGTVGEAARLVAFLCSNACDYLTGASITMDGGLTLGFCASRKDL